MACVNHKNKWKPSLLREKEEETTELMTCGMIAPEPPIQSGLFTIEPKDGHIEHLLDDTHKVNLISISEDNL